MGLPSREHCRILLISCSNAVRKTWNRLSTNLFE